MGLFHWHFVQISSRKTVRAILYKRGKVEQVDQDDKQLSVKQKERGYDDCIFGCIIV